MIRPYTPPCSPQQGVIERYRLFLLQRLNGEKYRVAMSQARISGSAIVRVRQWVNSVLRTSQPTTPKAGQC